MNTIDIHQSMTLHMDSYSITIDSEGNWKTCRMGERLFRRLVNGQVVEMERNDPKRISDAGISQIRSSLSQGMRELAEKAKAGNIPAEACNINDSKVQYFLLSKGAELAKVDPQKINEYYNEAYPEAVTMLPPDRYRDLVLLPAVGCPSGKCEFCTLYTAKGFQVFSEEQFREHIDRVIELFGHATKDRRGIFLGSASALSLSQRRLVNMLRIIKKKLGIPERGIASFFDPYHAPKRTLADYLQLKELGLQQLTLGLETGSSLLRKRWGKSGDLDKLKEVVDVLKKAGFTVALTVLMAFHQDVNFLRHQKDTTDLLNSLPLTKNDIIYLSPLQPAVVARQTSEEQLQSLKEGFRSVSEAKIVPYRVDRFRYFA